MAVLPPPVDALPAAVLRIKDGATSELCVRTCLARGVDLARHTGLNVEQLATAAASADPSERATLARLFGIVPSRSTNSGRLIWPRCPTPTCSPSTHGRPTDTSSTTMGA